MERTRRAVALVAVLATLGLAVGCGDDDPGDDATEASTDETSDATATTGTEGDGGSTSVADAPTIGTATTEFGEVLTDPYGYTLYIFDEDEGQPAPTCVDECSDKWPGLITDEVVDNPEVDIDVGLVDRHDGFRQVTVNGRPVYTMAEETEPGQTLCQGGDGVWWILSINGEPIRSTDPPATANDLG